MFYSALALHQKLGAVPSKHTGTISTFDREFVGKGIFSTDLSKSFHKAFDLRQTSDYKTVEPISMKKAEPARLLAGNVGIYQREVRLDR
jgi:uncharacterized protein (UPF0332 family)